MCVQVGVVTVLALPLLLLLCLNSFLLMILLWLALADRLLAITEDRKDCELVLEGVWLMEGVLLVEGVWPVEGGWPVEGVWLLGCLRLALDRDIPSDDEVIVLPTRPAASRA